MSGDGLSGAGTADLLRARALSWGVGTLWLTALLFLAGAAAYSPSLVATGNRNLVEDVVLPGLITSLFATVGAIVALRRPGHLIGWLLLVVGWLLALAQLSNAYAHHVVLAQPDAALLAWAAQLQAVAFLPAFIVLVFVLPLVFPDGRLPSPRWRIVAWAAAVLLPVGVLIEVVLRPGPITSFPQVTNPLGVAAVGPLADALDTWLAALLFGPFLIAAATAIGVRLRRSDTVERQQFMWVAFPMALMLVFVPLNDLLVAEAGAGPPFLLASMFVVGFGGLPVGIGIAVLRYRLYEIDRIVSRTVTYGLVTVTLIGVYAGAAMSLGWVTRMVTAQASSDLVVAASTLAVIALFGPLRRRAQHLVDRRFYRSRYNAGQVVKAFAARLRENVDLDELQTDLAAAVRETLQPAVVGVWLPHQGEAESNPKAAPPSPSSGQNAPT